MTAASVRVRDPADKPAVPRRATSAKKAAPNPARAPRAAVRVVPATAIAYNAAKGVDAFVRRVAEALPMQLVELERQGVNGRFVKDFSKRIGVPAVRVYEILGVPKATAEKRSAEGTEITGASGQAAVAMARLLAKAQAIVGNSTSPAARGFDAGKWLGQWIELPQPALGGRRPAELIGTPTGAEIVSRLLGAIESGAYQ